MDAPRAAPHAAQTPAREKPDRLPAARAGADRRAVELPRAAAAQPAGRSHLGGLHRPAQTLSLHPERRRGARGDDRRDLRRGVRRRRAGRPRGQHPAVRHALGRDLLHGKPRAGTDRDDRRGPQPHARRAGTGRQKPLDRGPRRRHRGRGAPHRLGQDPQRRADLHRTRLPADPPIAARRVLPSLRPRPASASRRRRAAKPPLRSAGQRPGFRPVPFRRRQHPFRTRNSRTAHRCSRKCCNCRCLHPSAP